MRLNAPRVTRAGLAAFADATGDTNPLHLDTDAARAAGFDDVIAHGMLTMGWLGRLVTSVRRQQDLVSFTVRFTAPTPLGSEPVLTCERADASTYEVGAELEDGTVTATGLATFTGEQAST